MSQTLFKSSKRGCFYNPPRELPPDNRNPIQRWLGGVKLLKIEFRRFFDEVKENLKMDPPRYYFGDVIAAYRFNNEECLKKFDVITDNDHDRGFSKAELTLTDRGTALFKGILDTRVPKDGITMYSGLAAIQTFPNTISFYRRRYLYWQEFSHLVVRCRGDGRSYTVNLTVFEDFDITTNVIYQYPLFTRGGPYWQVSYIPFSKFVLSYKGRVQDKQNRIPLNSITRVGVALADSNSGPFELEIDFIGVAFVDAIPEDFAYEMYETPNGYGLA